MGGSLAMAFLEDDLKERWNCLTIVENIRHWVFNILSVINDREG